MSECKVYRREIEGAADGAALGADARAHAALCRACGDELRERQRLRSLVGALGKVEAPADFEFRLRARMAGAKIDRGHGRFSGSRWLYGFAPVAVAACFVVVSATLYFRQAARPTGGDAPAVASKPAQTAEPVQAPSVNTQNRHAEPKVEVKEVARVNPSADAPPKVHKPVHRAGTRATQSREVASKGLSRTDVAPGTLEMVATGAPVIRQISVRASAEPLRLIVRDETGAERVVPMRSVSFGSQDFLSRGAAPKPAAAAEVGGVW